MMEITMVDCWLRIRDMYCCSEGSFKVRHNWRRSNVRCQYRRKMVQYSEIGLGGLSFHKCPCNWQVLWRKTPPELYKYAYKHRIDIISTKIIISYTAIYFSHYCEKLQYSRLPRTYLKCRIDIKTNSTNWSKIFHVSENHCNGPIYCSNVCDGQLTIIVSGESTSPLFYL